MIRLGIWLILSFMIIASLNAAQIAFTTNDPIIHPVLTKNLTLRCSVQDVQPTRPSTTLGPLSVAIYTAAYATTTRPSFLNVTAFHESNYSTTPGAVASTQEVDYVADVAHVMSIIISKVNRLTNQLETVADVTPFETATAGPLFKVSVRVEGNSQSSSVHGEKGFLQVSWDYPNEDESGQYVCEIFALNQENHPVTIRSNLVVVTREPSISDLAQHIANHEKRFDELKSRHIQKGSFDCTNNYSSRVNFSPAFNTTPLIFTSLVKVSLNNNYPDAGITVTSVTTSSFNYNCLSRASSTIEWLAIENN